MKQKFENLGLILSRDAQKKLVGGEEKTVEFNNCTSTCYSWSSSTNRMENQSCFYVQGTPIISGFCACPGSGTCS